MNKKGPIIIIEDDYEDQEIMKHVFNILGYPHKLIFFNDGQLAVDFLEKTDVKPFLVLSDINMPKLSGFEVRAKLQTDAQLEIKCTPYLFFTTASSQKYVTEAYSMSIQGFFVKPDSIQEMSKTITVIME